RQRRPVNTAKEGDVAAVEHDRQDRVETPQRLGARHIIDETFLVREDVAESRTGATSDLLDLPDRNPGVDVCIQHEILILGHATPALAKPMRTHGDAAGIMRGEVQHPRNGDLHLDLHYLSVFDAGVEIGNVQKPISSEAGSREAKQLIAELSIDGLERAGSSACGVRMLVLYRAGAMKLLAFLAAAAWAGIVARDCHDHVSDER